MAQMWNDVSKRLIGVGLSRKAANAIIEEVKKREFCSDCGYLSGVEAFCGYSKVFRKCGKALCSDCLNKCDVCDKYFCRDHFKKHECAQIRQKKGFWKCYYCREEFGLKAENMKKLEEYGNVAVRCPYCKKKIR